MNEAILKEIMWCLFILCLDCYDW